jgi:4-hydroxybenzoate polyprenyltransferase
VNWRVALQLGRVSNLPTVWTNVLAGGVLAGGGARDGRLGWVALAVSLCYVAGMFLNDAFDREFDERHRPDRPIPSGAVTATVVFGSGFALLAAGVVMLAWVGYRPDGTGAGPLLASLALAGAIVVYDWRHKQAAWSPVVMGLCRLLVYVVAASAVVSTVSGQVWVAGLVLLSYLVGLTWIARQEHLNRLSSLWPCLFLAAPLGWAAWFARDAPIVLLCALAWLAWMLFALSFLRRRRAGDVPRAVGYLLAGICLWDAIVLASAGNVPAAALAAVAFASTLLLQKVIAAT